MSQSKLLPAESHVSHTVVGERINTKNGRKLVTGTGRFLDDILLPGMMHARFVRSPHAHARILNIDTSKALEIPGVELVWTAEDIDPYVVPFSHPENAKHLGFVDEETLASDRVRYVGDEVAVVLAKDRNTAIEAADAVEVEYEKLPAVVDVESALREDAPILHPHLSKDPSNPITGNLIYSGKTFGGDTKTAISKADVVVKATFTNNKTNPSPLEPHGCIADWNNGDQKLTLWASTQVPHRLPELISTAVVDLNPKNLICKVSDVGGGFGAKVGRYSHHVVTCVLSMYTGRPVKMFFDRVEEMQAGRGRYDETMNGTLAVTKDGKITALDIDMVQNTGAYANYGAVIAKSSALTCGGPYLIPNQEVRYKLVYTNIMPGTAVRGFGNPQFMYAVDQLIDMAAAELGIDAFDLRLLNVPKLSDLPVRTATRLKLRDMDVYGCLTQLRDRIKWDENRGSRRTSDGKLRGIGVGTVMQRNGNKSAKGADYSGAIVRMDRFGSVSVFSGTSSIGTGTPTGIVQMVAETLGVSTDIVDIVVGDTDITPEDMGVWGDRSSVFAGTAATMAAEVLKGKIVRLAAHLLNVDESRVELSNGSIFEHGNPKNGFTVEEFANIATYGDLNNRPDDLKSGVSLIGEARFETQEGEFMDENGTGSVSHVYTFSSAAVIVEVDLSTGEIDIVDMAIAEDAGTIINPKFAAGQVQGAVTQALGEVLLEEYHYESDGSLGNGTLIDYHLPTAADMPLLPEDSIIHIETPDPTTSFGQKGLGECATVTIFPAVANAVADATGIRFSTLPLSPSKVLPALIDAGLREL